MRRTAADTGSTVAGGAAGRDRTRRNERFASARTIVGYDGEDEWRVLLTRELVVARASLLASQMQSALLGHPDTARAFVPGDGEGRSRHMEQLRTWLGAFDGPFNGETALGVAAFARTYTSRGENPDVQVKARYLLAAFGALQAAIASLLIEHIGDAAELKATVSAWNKLVMLHLDVVLATYDSLAPGPHWY